MSYSIQPTYLYNPLGQVRQPITLRGGAFRPYHHSEAPQFLNPTIVPAPRPLNPSNPNRPFIRSIPPSTILVPNLSNVISNQNFNETIVIEDSDDEQNNEETQNKKLWFLHKNK